MIWNKGENTEKCNDIWEFRIMGNCTCTSSLKSWNPYRENLSETVYIQNAHERDIGQITWSKRFPFSRWKKKENDSHLVESMVGKTKHAHWKTGSIYVLYVPNCRYRNREQSPFASGVRLLLLKLDSPSRSGKTMCIFRKLLKIKQSERRNDKGKDLNKGILSAYWKFRVLLRQIFKYRRLVHAFNISSFFFLNKLKHLQDEMCRYLRFWIFPCEKRWSIRHQTREEKNTVKKIINQFMIWVLFRLKEEHTYMKSKHGNLVHFCAETMEICFETRHYSWI